MSEIQEEKFNLKIGASEYYSHEMIRGLLDGKYEQHAETHSFMYILQNLSNVNLTVIPFKEVKAMVDHHVRKLLQNEDLGDLFEAHPRFYPFNCVFYGFCDTALKTFKTELRSDIRFSPTVEVLSFKIITVINDGKETGKRFSLGGFQTSVWMWLLGSLMLLSVVCGLFKMRFLRSSIGKRFPSLEYVWFYFSHLLLNPADIFPRGLSAKLLLSGWILGTTVLIKAYSGILKSELAVSTSIRVNTIEDTKKYPGMKLAISRDDTIAIYYLHNSREFMPAISQPLKEAFYFPFYKHSLFETFPNGTTKYAVLVREDLFKSKLTEDATLKKIKKRGQSVYFGKIKYMVIHGSFMFKMDLPKRILKRVDFLSRRYIETGQSYLSTFRDDFKLRPVLAKDSATEVNKATAVTVDEMTIAFYIWFCGITIACFTLLFEILTKQLGIWLSKESRQRGITFSY